jgi:hypothetical protein
MLYIKVIDNIKVVINTIGKSENVITDTRRRQKHCYNDGNHPNGPILRHTFHATYMIYQSFRGLKFTQNNDIIPF